MRIPGWAVGAAAVVASAAVLAAVLFSVLAPDESAQPAASASASPASPKASPPPRKSAPPNEAEAERRRARMWAPAPGTRWQWQLTTPVDLGVDVPVHDIDGFGNGADVVREVHRRGRRVICYINVGAAESYRPDNAAFPAAVLGKGNGWPGERWLDIRRTDVLAPIMARRFDMCRDKGFDAVEPDLLDGYASDTGFPLTAAHQLRYNRLIARLAHERGMSVALKNDLAQIPALVGTFDFAINEQCAEFGECRRLLPFVRAGKAVLHVEYNMAAADFCRQTRALGFASMRKRLDLDAWRQPC
ncbi:endo alpha-1,4 polygalactosaminidase [Actinomadura sp. KC06]|uniref:endo alpha-1,4 polygalactosaminidase n=1 Tax=Actinomadura sp. KC06 TaxID=2530369 RepID=UPI001A9F1162|nr:endo alpha-1,4 polygalactosaminidase [Actinomadura sp. KC06]